MSRPISDRTVHRVFGSSQITRLVLMDAEDAAAIDVSGQGVPNYSHLLVIKLLLPEASRQLIVPATSYANAALYDISATAMRRFRDAHQRRLAAVPESRSAE